MENHSTDFKKLFLPLTCLLILIGGASTLLHQLGSFILSFLIIEKINPISLKPWMELGSLLFFAIVILFLRNVSFKKIFRAALLMTILLTISSVFLFPNTSASYFILTIFCSKVLFFLGWAYANQITTQVEGTKYYFALNFITQWLLIPFALIPTGLIFTWGTAHTSTPFLAGFTLLILGLVWLCDRWVSKRTTDKISPENINPVSSSSKWLSMISLAGLASGMTLISNLNQPSIKAYFIKLAPTANEFAALTAHYLTIVGIGTFALSILSLLIGPRLLQSKGWKLTMLIAPAVGVVAILVTFINFLPFGFPSQRALLRALSDSWIFPLIHVALLNYSQKDRFLIQAYVFLVFSPLLTNLTPGIPLAWGTKILQVASFPITITSFAILGLMTACAWIVAKRQNSAISIIR